ncbi:polysaccharide pyruvyl transferase CsaB [Pseudalkalibacillus salsuginis]|uniref:polysaccharide pyruvyl transferase CsaB n=1 Tax=Pseudalkalibacillus salsuginis TaxID=2910972 RepID=UPI001F482AA3|nr:polysaccharide pyruvyl transferase CsaB [Pseudalkalibacillus salsuginis]MCF6410114.1 polysaccharide pyruvyl transferase CsaB [Pseudalkalibacillus salsuginis]
MKLVISGYYGFNNIGDEAILASIIQSLKEIQPDIEIVVLSNKPELTKSTYGVDAVDRWNFKAILKALKESGGLISGGGSLLQDQTGWKSVPYYSGIMYLAKLLRKPVYMYAQGIGPLDRFFNKWIVKVVLNKVNRITVRDEESKRLLENLRIKKNIQIVPDPVMGFRVENLKSDWISGRKFNKPIVTVSVRDWKGLKNFKIKVAGALDRLIDQRQVEIIFIPMHGWHDHNTSVEVAKLMKNPSEIAPYDASIEEKIAIIGSSEFLFGMRLHSLIFAGIAGTPFLALSYDPKIDSYSNLTHQPVAGHVEQGDLNDLPQILLESYQNRKARLELMRGTTEEMKLTAKETAKLAISSLSSNKGILKSKGGIN